IKEKKKRDQAPGYFVYDGLVHDLIHWSRPFGVLTHISQGAGFSRPPRSVWRNRAAGAPSTTRWSNVRLSVSRSHATIWSPTTAQAAARAPGPSGAASRHWACNGEQWSRATAGRVASTSV